MRGPSSNTHGSRIPALLNTSGGIHESYMRGVSIAGDIGGLVSVTRHPFNTQYYVHNNHRGDITHVRNGTSTSTTYRYSAFGKLLQTTGPDYCRFKFSSKELNASCGLYYYGYRFYAPQWQRWMNRDPIGERGGQNLTQFVLNHPADHVDALGLDITPNGKLTLDPETCVKTTYYINNTKSDLTNWKWQPMPGPGVEMSVDGIGWWGPDGKQYGFKIPNFSVCKVVCDFSGYPSAVVCNCRFGKKPSIWTPGGGPPDWLPQLPSKGPSPYE